MNTPSRTEPTAHIDTLARAAIGAAIEVHQLLGPGYLEAVYQEALRLELHMRGVPFRQQVPFRVSYKQTVVGKGLLDFLIGCSDNLVDNLVVEIKAVDALAPIHKAQVISYLRSTGCRLALLINFNVPLLKEGIRRVVLS
jgi:GxxExxY protein